MEINNQILNTHVHKIERNEELEKDASCGETIKIEDVDDGSEKIIFERLDIIWILICIMSYLFDTATDIAVAYRHYKDNNNVYCGLTLAFILIPLLIMTGFSLRWYLLDAELPGTPSVSQHRWAWRIVFLLLQLGPLLRYIDVLYYGLKSRTKSADVKTKVNYYLQMIYEDADATLLRLFESFMEAAPQLVLQLYILSETFTNANDYKSKTAIIQILSIFASLTSLSWALASYHRALRMSLPDKLNMSCQGTVVQMLWHYFIIASRVLAIGLFASFSPTSVAAVLVSHWCIMTAWIISMRTNFCDTRFEELAYNAVLGVLFLFCYFNPKDSPTRYRYLFYYTFTLIENTILMSIWYHYTPRIWFHFPAIIIQFLSFILGIFFMITYYLLLHPTGNIRWDGMWKTVKHCSQRNHQCNNQTPVQLVLKEDPISI